MKLKLQEIININAALSALNGYQDTVVVKGENQTVLKPYLFASTKTSWNIAKNRRLIKSAIEDYTEVRNGLIREISGGVEIKEDNLEQMAQFTSKEAALLKEEVEVEGLLKLNLSELLNEKIDEHGVKTFNPIPADVFNLLFELIEDDSK
jgi:hypothetical protein